MSPGLGRTMPQWAVAVGLPCSGFQGDHAEHMRNLMPTRVVGESIEKGDLESRIGQHPWKKRYLNLVAHLALWQSTSPLYSPLRGRRGSKIEDAVERGEIPRPARPGDGGEVSTRGAALEMFSIPLWISIANDT